MNEDFVKIANTNEIPKSQIKEIEIEVQKIIIANIDGNFYAIGGICTHEGGPLSEVVFQVMKLNVHGTEQNLM
ncbi:MAG TPA: Rieske 2Fe-2S domain-containing protein [Verrucomicrobiae bacterium]|nr:Rieske 2Fe-2S domain-containing protein [Verrucomicrobiae bacterium]